MENEILLIDKPAGMSSFGVVARVRRVLTEKARKLAAETSNAAPKRVKVGHTGTLDPFATGLLILLVGKGTKRSNKFLKLDKKYEAMIRLGKVSTTGDTEGDVMDFSVGMPARQEMSYTGKRQEYTFPDSQVKRSMPTEKPYPSPSINSEPRKKPLITPEEVGGYAFPDSQVKGLVPTEKTCPSLEEVQEVAKSFIGEIEQRVPAYSAVKINGQRAYKLAREGKAPEMPVRKVQIYDIKIVDYKWPELKIVCHVSSGTYIRTLGEDIGAKLGVGGYLTQLRRTEVGTYKVTDAETLDEFMAGSAS